MDKGTSFNPLWINTALKLCRLSDRYVWSFNPLWINTALKQCVITLHKQCVSIPYGLTLLSNHNQNLTRSNQVSIPYGLTLLSNHRLKSNIRHKVSIPYGLTLLSNLKFEKTTCISLYYSLGNFILNYISHKSRSMIKRLSFAILSYSLFSKKIT